MLKSLEKSLKLLRSRLFHNHINTGNSLFPRWKQSVSQGETNCFLYRNDVETVSFQLKAGFYFVKVYGKLCMFACYFSTNIHRLNI